MRRLVWGLGLLALILGIMVSIRAAIARKEESEVAMLQARVELDIFSGRPNPAWLLSAEEAQTLKKRLASLPPAPSTEPSAHLGYRGFVVDFADPTVPTPTAIHVFNGVIRYGQGMAATYWSDRDRQLERWLLTTAKTRLDSQLYATVAAEVGLDQQH